MLREEEEENTAVIDLPMRDEAPPIGKEGRRKRQTGTRDKERKRKG